MKNFHFNTICNITQEPQELQRYNRACRFLGKSAVIKMSSVAIKSYKYYQEIAFRPVSNSYLLSLSLTTNNIYLIHLKGFCCTLSSLSCISSREKLSPSIKCNCPLSLAAFRSNPCFGQNQ